METLDLRIIANGKMGSFHKDPGQILVAVFDVAAFLASAIADLGVADSAIVGNVAAHGGKTTDIAGFHHDGYG
jgi:hypothetical protein